MQLNVIEADSVVSIAEVISLLDMAIVVVNLVEVALAVLRY